MTLAEWITARRAHIYELPGGDMRNTELRLLDAIEAAAIVSKLLDEEHNVEDSGYCFACETDWPCVYAEQSMALIALTETKP